MLEEIREFIAHLTLLEPEQLSPETILFSSGIIDSLNLIHLIEFLEKKYLIKVSPIDLTLDHFDSIERIAHFVEIKKQ